MNTHQNNQLELLMKQQAQEFELEVNQDISKQLFAAIEREDEREISHSQIKKQENPGFNAFKSNWMGWLAAASFVALIVVISPQLDSLSGEGVVKTTSEIANADPIVKGESLLKLVQLEKSLENVTFGKLDQESAAIKKDMESIFKAFAIKTPQKPKLHKV